MNRILPLLCLLASHTAFSQLTTNKKQFYDDKTDIAAKTGSFQTTKDYGLNDTKMVKNFTITANGKPQSHAEFDTKGRIIRLEEYDWDVFRYEYAENLAVRKKIQAGKVIAIDSVFFDNRGNRIKNSSTSIMQTISGTMYDGTFATFEYDGNNRLVKEKSFKFSTGNHYVILEYMKKREYYQDTLAVDYYSNRNYPDNPNNEESRLKKNNNDRYIYVYNKAGLISEMHTFNTSCLYSFDSFGRIEGIRNGSEGLAFHYDSKGNIVEEVMTLDGKTNAIYRYQYDDHDSIILKTYYNDSTGYSNTKDIQKRLYFYDSAGNWVKFQQYDNQGKQVAITATREIQYY
jgi:hypothetical protein